MLLSSKLFYRVKGKRCFENDQRQRYVGGIVAHDAQRVRHQDTALPGLADTDVVDARAVIGDELGLVPRLLQKPRVDLFGDRGHELIGATYWVIRVSGPRKVSPKSGKRSVTTTLRCAACMVPQPEASKLRLLMTNGKRGKAQAPVDAGRKSMIGSGWAAWTAAALMAFAIPAWGQEPMAADGLEVMPAALAPDTAPAEKVVPRDLNRGSVTGLPLPRYVSLKTNEGNARRGPGQTYRIDWVFTRAGMPLRITAEFEHWRRVEDVEGLGGWVNYSLLSGVRTGLVSLDMAEFRTLPDPSAPVVLQTEMGVIGRILQCEPGWCRMSVEGQRGWVQSGALWGVDPDEIIE
jgi:SH3-like domain-containing protein